MAEARKTETRAEKELRILEYWKSNQIYSRHKEKNASGPLFCFYEGPPTANGRPGIHHVLSRVYKDIYIRFRGLQGYHIPRKAGWDCHGLPVEREVEKELGIKAKSEIETDVGLEKFNDLCRKSVLKYVDSWNEFSERLGFWVDLDDPYFTMDNQYIEGVWGLFKKIHEKGLLYQGYKVVPFDPVMGATMSDAEVALGYKTVEDPSFTVRFAIKDEAFNKKFGEVSFLVWTTTPWTLPSNVALALHPEADYVLFEVETGDDILAPAGETAKASSAAGAKKEKGTASGKKSASSKKSKNSAAKKSTKAAKSHAEAPQAEPAKNNAKGQVERFICARDLLSDVLRTAQGTEKVLAEFKGVDLLGLDYAPLFDFAISDLQQKAHFTIGADFVTMDTGTGIVHIAPAYGADDLEVGQSHGLPVVAAVGLDGKFSAGPYAGA
ncbi:MAG: class I tRNA ligase family protein, partial [Leptospiraceae bacterium]|nr:class I tRNA ligase family protein [Leptospiraceae bacterium]